MADSESIFFPVVVVSCYRGRGEVQHDTSEGKRDTPDFRFGARGYMRDASEVRDLACICNVVREAA